MESPKDNLALPIVERLNHSLALFSVLALVLHLVGSVQEFLDDTQWMLLHVLRVTALAGAGLGLWALGWRGWLAVTGRRARFGSVILDAVLLIFDLALLAGVDLLLSWTLPPAG